MNQDESLKICTQTCVWIIGQAYRELAGQGFPEALAREFSVAILRVLIDNIVASTKKEPEPNSQALMAALLAGGKTGPGQ